MSLWDDVDTDVSEGRSFWDGGSLEPGEKAVVTLEEDLRPAEESQFAPVEAEATVDDGDLKEVLYAPSAKTQLSDLEDLDPGEGDKFVVTVDGEGMDRTYTVEGL